MNNCLLSTTGLKPKRVLFIPLKENGVYIDKCLKVTEGGAIHKMLLKQGVKLNFYK